MLYIHQETLLSCEFCGLNSMLMYSKQIMPAMSKKLFIWLCTAAIHYETRAKQYSDSFKSSLTTVLPVVIALLLPVLWLRGQGHSAGRCSGPDATSGGIALPRNCDQGIALWQAVTLAGRGSAGGKGLGNAGPLTQLWCLPQHFLQTCTESRRCGERCTAMKQHTAMIGISDQP